jgi:hypothetical protein
VASGRKNNPVRWASGYFATLWEVLTRPSDFFRHLPVSGGIAGPLAFALISNWIGSALSFLWALIIGGALADHLSSLFKVAGDVVEVDYPGKMAQFTDLKERLTHWMLGAGSVILDPFITVVSVLITSFFVFIGARLLVSPGKNGAPSEITYESALRVVSYGMGPAILAGIPIFGPVISYLCVVIVTVIAAKELYHVPQGRAIAVALFPKLLYLAIILGAVLLLILFAVKFLISAFGM